MNGWSGEDILTQASFQEDGVCLKTLLLVYSPKALFTGVDARPGQEFRQALGSVEVLELNRHLHLLRTRAQHEPLLETDITEFGAYPAREEKDGRENEVECHTDKKGLPFNGHKLCS